MERTKEPIEYLDFEPAPVDVRSQVHELLSLTQKRLPTMLLYDEKGSQLFDRICELPEYYPTRTEIGILSRHASEMADVIGPKSRLVEFGSGSSVKTRILLDELEDPVSYVPIDISREHLLATSETIAHEYPEIPVQPIVADYMAPFELPEPPETPQQTSGFFPGSTLGNLEGAEGVEFLRNVHDVVGASGALLIGADLRKDTAILEAAYNDSAGVTAAFNLNALNVVNERVGADFDLANFHHRAVYDENAGRVEMRLISRMQQSVQVGDEQFEFEQDEYIVTEYSHKYRMKDVEALAAQAGMSVERTWTDPERLFSVQFLRVSPGKSDL